VRLQLTHAHMALIMGARPEIDGIGTVRTVPAVAAGEGNGAGDQPAIVVPVEAKPRTTLAELILPMGGLAELLVVIDAKYTAGGDVAPAQQPICGRKKRDATPQKTTRAENRERSEVDPRMLGS